MKISVITLQAIRNYGSALQTYATESILRGMGHDVETVNYIREAARIDSVRSICACHQSGYATKLKQILLLPTTRRQKLVFDAFNQKYLHLTKQVYTYDEDFNAQPIEADVYCTGSDQVWNTDWHGEIPKPFFLSYAPKEKKKIAFSASFGKETLAEWEKPGIKELLSRYDAISVREESAVQILEDLQLQGTWVLDPTLVAGRGTWETLAAPRQIAEDYVLVYQLGRDKAFNRYAKAYAKKHGLKLVRICMRLDHAFRPGKSVVIPTPEVVLSLFRHASCVITDSFHATAFSLLFQRQFICIYPRQFSTRLESVLRLTGLQERHLTDYNDMDMGQRPIDYTRVDALLQAARERSLSFLQEALSEVPYESE